MPTLSDSFPQQKSGARGVRIDGLANGLERPGCGWISVVRAEMKKGAFAPSFSDRRTPMDVHGSKLERETRLELATSTLARLRSTN